MISKTNDVLWSFNKIVIYICKLLNVNVYVKCKLYAGTLIRFYRSNLLE